MKQKIHYLFMLLLMLLTGVGGVKAQTTYKLEKVTEVEAGGLYVFEQSGYVMTTVNSKVIQITKTYSKTGLKGSENYVFTLESATASDKKTQGFKMKNMSLSSYQYIGNKSNSTEMTATSVDAAAVWAFNFQDDQTVLIQNLNNSNRFLGFNSATSPTGYKAYAISNNMGSTPHDIVVYKLVEETGDEPVVVATPTFSPEAGEVSQGTEVTISTATEGATIYYTIDGSTPTENSTKGSSAVINEPTKLKAIAVKEGCENSEVAEATYTIKQTIAGYAIDFENSLDAYVDWTMTNVEQGTGTITAHGGNYYGTTGGKATASIQTKEKIANPGLFTCYISKTSSNTTSSTWYVQVSSDGEIWTDVTTASATDMSKGSWNEVTAKLDTYSDVYVRLYYNGSTAVRTVDDISLKMSSSVKIPVISLESGSYYEAKSVTIECATEGAKIYYTRDGSEPTAESTEYKGAITIDKTTTLKAIAIKGEDASDVVIAEYKVVITEGKGTVDNPFTVADARNILKEGLAPTDVYVTGIVSGIVEAYSSKFGNISYNISDDGATESGQLQAYRGKGKNGANFTSDADIQVKDKVVLKGNLINYEGTYELAANNQLVSLERNTLSAPTFSVEAGTYKEELSVTINCATEGATIYYSFDNENWTLYESPVTISESKTLYAKAEKGDKVEIASAEYTILIDKEIQGYKYEKVTSTEDITDGQYLIVYEDGKVAFDGSLETLDAVSNTMEVTIENNEIAATTFKQAAEFTIDVTAGTLKSASGKYIGVNSNDNGLKQVDDVTTYKNSFAIDNDDNAVISAVFGESTMTLRFNSASNQNRFRYYKSGQQAIQLYKLVKIVPPAAPTFSPAAGEVEKGTSVTITAEEGAKVKYTIGETTTTAESETVTVTINEDVTIKAVAVKDGVESEEVSAAYTVKAEEPVVEPGTPAAITAGFYTIKNLGNNQFVNVAGRKTATLVDNAEGMAGTVIQVESDADGIVKTLRSQGVDVPGYATRAMKYVPDVVKLVVEKLHVSGSGEILGETGVDKILDKFNKSVDVNLHVVHADGGYRIYGKTPSMTPVKEFYQENKANVDAKLPGLEQAINDAIATIVDKVGKGASLKNTFKLETIWKRMGWTDYEPGTEETTQVAFLQQVLANEENIWNFAYQTAMFYMEWVEGKQAFQEMQNKAPELMKYWNLAKKVRPNFMYYIVQKDGKVDVISQGNEAILNNDKSTVWALEEVSEFKVNLTTYVEKTAYPTSNDGETTSYTEYYGTLYTDFAYRLPEGVTAYKVTGINTVGDKAYVKKAELNSEVVPAQTPVLLIANTRELTLTIAEGGEAVADNQLYGNDYLINEYDINTPQLEGVFTLLAELSQSTYDKYEYLMRKNAGTVNNKYFFGIAVEGELADAYKAKTGNEMKASPIRKLGLNTDEKVGFIKSWDYLAGNEGFMFSEEVSEILMNIVGDVNRDGTITISDVTALVNIILGKATYPADADKYDFEAADVNTDKTITISDVTALVNIILGKTQN